MADIGSLVVRIAADASALHKEFAKMGSGAQDFGSKLATAGKMGATAVLAVTSALVANTLAIAAQTEETEQMSQKTGISVQTLQSWSVIMAENSVKAETMTQATKKLSQQIVEAQNPSSQAAESFNQLGISITELGSTENVIRSLADKFKAMPDGAEKAALAVDLFGKAGLDMIPILNRGSKAFDESKAAAQRFGLVLSTEQVQALTAADDASDQLGMALQGLRTKFAIAFAPAIKSSIDFITEAIVKMGQSIFGVQDAIQDNSWEAFKGRAIVEETQEYNKRVEASEAVRMEAEEELGRKMVARFIRNQKLLEAEGKAQEQLGKDVNAIAERERAERNQDFGERMLQMEKLQSLSEGLGEGGHEARGGDFEASVKHQHEMIRNLETIGLSTGDWQDQIDRGNEQEAAGLKIQRDSLALYEHRHDAQRLEIELAESVAEEQAALFQQEQGLFGASDAARTVQMRLIDERYALERALIEEMTLLEEQKAIKIQALDQRTNAQRMRVAQQFPGFWEQQLNAIQASNVFSMGQMVSTWSNALAVMIVKGGDLKAAWEATKIAIVQAGINMAVSMAASGLKMVIAQEAAAAGTSAAWVGAGTVMSSIWAAVTTAFSAMFATMVSIITAVGTAVIGVLSAIASALTATVFGIPWAGAILLGIALIAGALIALKAIKFAEGGVVTGPTLGMVGEAGPEAIIPLDRLGEFGGGNNRQPIITELNIDGKKFMKAVSRYTASGWRAEGAPA